MIQNILKKIFGSQSERVLKGYKKFVEKINQLESAFEVLSDDELKGHTDFFKKRLQEGESLDDILPEAFATVREASKRVFGMRHFDVQLYGGIALHKGTLVEMKTGEGKTLVATLPVYLNALTGKGVHVITVNDYLASRDAETMGKLYGFLGLTTGVIIHGLTDSQRKRQYNCDITHGTNHEFGFDYLRDNMKFRIHEMVMRPFHFAIVDEVDSILIDEARTPLIISGSAENSSDLYKSVNAVIPILNDTDFEKDEKQRNITLTESGVEKLEKTLMANGVAKGNSLYDAQNVAVVHHINCALKAHKLFIRDVDYIVKDGKVILIDEFTGRMMDGRRYSDGLHQAIEAKENVEIEQENQTLASVTYQNFFRLYPKLAGMSGTVITEADEFEEIYKLKAVEIPTNVPVSRQDFEDEIYLTAKEKHKALAAQIKTCHEKGQPVLVGTTSIEKSEILSTLLKQEGLPHQVLNARFHEQEASIIANAGQPGAITIATNMAGRGTDIKLGGNLDMRIQQATQNIEDEEQKAHLTETIKKEVAIDNQKALAAGGLYVIGTERHESRRIDNQLRGRSGRQGDPGASKFFISLEDDLMRIFGSDNMAGMLRKMGAQENEVISHSWMTKAIERAQQKVEARNFDVRKHLLKYDDVMNDQRKVIYEQRRELMTNEDMTEDLNSLYEEVIEEMVDLTMPENALPDAWDLTTLHEEAYRMLNLDIPVKKLIEDQGMQQREIKQYILSQFLDFMKAKETELTPERMRIIERDTMLRHCDFHWKNHLLALDQLRQGINLRAYAQSNPLHEYHREAFNLFHTMLDGLKGEFVTVISHITSGQSSHDEIDDSLLPHIDFSKFEELTPGVLESKFNEVKEQFEQLNRNAMCHCGSGKKFKHCHGSLT